MSGFIEIQHDEWVAASVETVRAHYVDLHHRELAPVHPRERLRQREPGPIGPRFECRARAGWWRGDTDLYVRHERLDGSVLDHCVAGPHWGRAIVARAWPSNDGPRVGTLLEMTLTQPVRPVLGRFLGRWLRRRLEDELREFAREIRLDVERGYRQPQRLRVVEPPAVQSAA
jgi:hypothetical protein